MKFSVILGNLGNTCDRFLSSGYKEQPSKVEMVRQAASIEGVQGIELVGTWDVTPDNAAEVAKMLRDSGLQCVSIIPDHFSQKRWGRGAFTSLDAAVRKQAVQVTKEMMDIAAEMGCDLINLWPGQDGYDYCLQADFLRARDWLIEAVRDCAAHRSDVRIALEYKPKEPRTHSYLAKASDTLLVALETECDTVGVTIDFGHALVAGENVAESAALLIRHEKLFHLHFNDNYRAWDDDMMVGSVHLVEYLELLYWLRKLDYRGWYSMDQYPYREDARAAINESIRWLSALGARLDSHGTDAFDQLIAAGDATNSSRVVREFLGLT